MKIAWVQLSKETSTGENGREFENSLMINFREKDLNGEFKTCDFHCLTLEDLEWMYQVLDATIKTEEMELAPDEIAVSTEHPTLIPSMFTNWAEEYFSKGNGHLNILMKREDVFKDFQKSTLLGKNFTMSRFMQNLRIFAESCPYIVAVNPSNLCSSPGRIVGKDGNGETSDYIFVKTTDKYEYA